MFYVTVWTFLRAEKLYITDIHERKLLSLSPRAGFHTHTHTLAQAHEQSPVFLSDLGSVPWSIIELFDDLDDALHAWEVLFTDVVNVHVPLRERRVKRPRQPGWLTDDITAAMATRDSYKQREDYINYKLCRNKVVAIFAPSACVLQEALTILQEEANHVGMQVSWPKTKLIAITPKPTNHLPLKICNKEVVFVDSFTYLGSLITNDGSSSRDITSRIAMAASAMCHLSNPLFRKHRISIRTKINMYRALVVSVLLYGSEAWATTLADRRRLDVFDMRCQRRLLRVFWQQHVSNQASVNAPSNQQHHPSFDNAACDGSDISTACHPPSLYEESLTSTLTPMVVRDQEAAPKPDGLIQSSTTSTQLASTPSMPHRWSMTDPQWNAFVCGLPTLEPGHGP